MVNCLLFWSKAHFVDEQMQHGGTILIDSTAATGHMYSFGAESLPTCWNKLLHGDRLHTHNIRLCNLGVRHPQNGRPCKASLKIIANRALPDMATCACGKPCEEHVKFGPRGVASRESQMLETQMMLLLMTHGAEGHVDLLSQQYHRVASEVASECITRC